MRVDRNLESDELGSYAAATMCLGLQIRVNVCTRWWVYQNSYGGFVWNNPILGSGGSCGYHDVADVGGTVRWNLRATM